MHAIPIPMWQAMARHVHEDRLHTLVKHTLVKRGDTAIIANPKIGSIRLSTKDLNKGFMVLKQSCHVVYSIRVTCVDATAGVFSSCMAEHTTGTSTSNSSTQDTSRCVSGTTSSCAHLVRPV
jgi:hypothetical protein